MQAWSPYLSKDIDGMERVQRRATKMINGYKLLNYDSRLEKTGLITLEKRRERGDLIQVFKLIKGFDDVDYKEFFTLAADTKTRGHKYKIVKARSRLTVRQNFFSNRVVNGWNGLPEWVVDAETVNGFKNRLDTFWSMGSVDNELQSGF